MADTVFVQSHFDDVALSCGGTVAELAGEESAVIVTVFGGYPGTSTSEFVRFQHDRWRLSDENAVDARREEDRSAALALGSSVDVVWLDYLDAIYRRSEYSSDDALFGDIVEADRALIEPIASQLSIQGNRFVLPLGIGNHVDHQLVFEAGITLARGGCDVWFYADLPYALDTELYGQRLGQVGDPTPCVRGIRPESFERRWRAIECYASQLQVIFRSIPDPREALERFGEDDTVRFPVELFWHMDDIDVEQK